MYGISCYFHKTFPYSAAGSGFLCLEDVEVGDKVVQRGLGSYFA